MRTIRLTQSDYQVLLMILGYAGGAHSKEGVPFPEPFKEVLDWVLIQGSEENHTYWHDKETLRAKKERELEDPKR